jgi:hypothetical protein
MVNSTVLEVVIGLIFCYASVALIVSSINEAIASAMKLRASSLLEGVKAMLNDPQFVGLARAVYNHALVNPAGDGAAKDEASLKFRPSYIDARHFAIALVDAVSAAPTNAATLERDIRAIADPQIKNLLLGLYARANGRLDDLHGSLARWFDAGMDSVSGGYKRRSQVACFAIALVISALFNVDSFHLFKVLWEHPALASVISQPGSASDALAALKSLPIGWPRQGQGNSASAVMVAGWVVTASATLFGAPFWFDLLQRLIRLRGTGPKPARELAPADQPVVP